MTTDNTSFGPAENEHRFGFHKATVEGDNATLPVHRATRLLFRQLADQLDAIIPPGRAKSAAWTILEDASMWIHKAIAEQAPVVDESGASGDPGCDNAQCCTQENPA